MESLFGQIELDEFWLRVKYEYAALSKMAIDKLLLFSTIYLCEAAFSTMTIIKTKQRNRLDAHDAMILATITIEPRNKELSKAVFNQIRKFD